MSTFSIGENHGGLHLSDKELDRITTASTLTLGSLQTHNIFIDGATHSDTPSDVYIISRISTSFVNNASTFATRVGIHADNDVTVGSNVSFSGGTVTIVADATCNSTGTFTITPTGSIASTDNAIWIQAYDVSLLGPLDSGTSATHFVGCSNVSIDVGGDGSSLTGQMRLARSELQLISSTNLTFNAESASIFVYETVISDTEKVLDRITFNAYSSLIFKQSCVFKSIRGAAPELNITNDVKVVEGHLVLEATKYFVESGVYVQSEAQNIYVEPTAGSSGVMHTSTPVTWRGINDIAFEVPLMVYGSGILNMVTDSDEDASGTLSFSPAAHVVVKDSSVAAVVLTVADIQLGSKLSAMDANVTIETTNSTNSIMSLGANHGGLHLSQIEFDRITTSQILTIGGKQTELVYVDGATRSDSTAGIEIYGRSHISFQGTASTFNTTLRL
jgi:hypothetical protein